MLGQSRTEYPWAHLIPSNATLRTKCGLTRQAKLGSKKALFWGAHRARLKMAGGAHRHVGWWGGKLTAYDPKTKKHKIEWDDGDDPWNEDLLNMRKAKEWRFLLKGEKKRDIVQSMD